MCFVDDIIFEAELLEGRFLDEANFVTRDANVEILRNEPICDDLCALFLGASEDDNVHVRGPLFELTRPILRGRFGDDY